MIAESRNFVESMICTIQSPAIALKAQPDNQTEASLFRI